MASKKNNKEKMVTIKVPRAPKGESNEISASVNGKTYLIKRGIPVQVPETLAEVIMNSERAQAEAIEYIESKVEKES